MRNIKIKPIEYENHYQYIFPLFKDLEEVSHECVETSDIPNFPTQFEIIYSKNKDEPGYYCVFYTHTCGVGKVGYADTLEEAKQLIHDEVQMIIDCICE